MKYKFTIYRKPYYDRRADQKNLISTVILIDGKEFYTEWILRNEECPEIDRLLNYLMKNTEIFDK